MAIWIKVDDHSAESVMKAFAMTLKSYGEKACIFVTIQSPNQKHKDYHRQQPKQP